MIRKGVVGATGVALCTLALAAPASAYKYVVKSNPAIPSGKVSKLVAKCPSGLKVTGGGVYNSGLWTQAKVTTTAPADGRDRKRKRDDAWVGYVRNNSAGPLSMEVTAICVGGRLKRKLSYVKATRRQQPNTEKAVLKNCPDGKAVVGGGMSSSRPRRAGTLTASVFDLLSGKAKPAYWQASYNTAAVPLEIKVTTYAICTAGKLRRGTHYLSGNASPSEVPGNSQSQDFAACDAGEHVLGGGGYAQSSNLSNVTINATAPSDGGDANSKPDDQWATYVDNFHPFETAYVVSAVVCR